MDVSSIPSMMNVNIKIEFCLFCLFLERIETYQTDRPKSGVGTRHRHLSSQNDSLQLLAMNHHAAIFLSIHLTVASDV